MGLINNIKSAIETKKEMNLCKNPDSIIDYYWDKIVKDVKDMNLSIEPNVMYTIKQSDIIKIKIKKTVQDSNTTRLLWIHYIDCNTGNKIWRYNHYVIFNTENQTLYTFVRSGQYPCSFTK